MAESPHRALAIEGRVLDSSGAPIANASVTLVIGRLVIAAESTGPEGKFKFETANAGEITIVVRARGFAPAERKWRAEELALNDLEIVLAPALLAEQVIITAARTQTLLSDTAGSVTLVSSDQLEVSAALRLDDALRQVPGFQLFRRSGSRTANPTSQGVSLRGVGASGASRALVLTDGIPLNDPFGSWIYWGRVPRSAVSRVEILSGGASHLYGSGALGGVVNIVKARPSSPFLSLEVSSGNQKTQDVNLFTSATRGKWSAGLGAEMFHTNGDGLVDEAERGAVDTPAGSRSLTIDLSLERNVGEAGRVFVSGSVFGEARANGTPLQINRTHIRQLSTGGDLEFGHFGSLTFRAYGGTQVFDQNFSAVSADRNSETITRIQRVPSQFAGLSLQWSRAIGSNHTVVGGLEASEVRGASDEILFARFPTSLIGSGGRERNFGLFVEEIVWLKRKVFFTMGGRLDRWRNYGALSTTRSLRQNGPAVVQSFSDRTETAFSPKVSALYKPFENITLSALFTRAFRRPTLNELYRDFRVGDVVTRANAQLRAERLTGSEAGLNLQFLNQRLITRATVFWAAINAPVANVTLSVSPNLITRQRQNLGRIRSGGFELDAEARFYDEWSITAGYLFADARVLEFPANTALEGLRIPQVAHHQLTFQIRYANPLRLTFGLQGRAGGEQFDDDQNRFNLPRYFTLDALVSRRVTNAVEIFAAAENLLNQRYLIGRTPVTTLGPPVLLRFGLRLKMFGEGAPKSASQTANEAAVPGMPFAVSPPSWDSSFFNRARSLQE